MSSNSLKIIMDDLIEHLARQFVWSEERPRPYKITDPHFRTFYYLNTFVCHKSIARRLA